jgi:hypothetical protein
MAYNVYSRSLISPKLQLFVIPFILLNIVQQLSQKKELESSIFSLKR